MKAKHYRNSLLFLFAIILFSFGQIVNNIYDKQDSFTSDAEQIQKAVLEKQRELKHYIYKLSQHDLKNDRHIWQVMDSLSQSKIQYYLFKDSVPFAWSNQNVPLSNYNIHRDFKPIQQFSNGWYLADTTRLKSYTILALNLLKEEYPYQNKFLKSSFDKKINLYCTPQIFIEENTTKYTISSLKNEYLFSLHFEDQLHLISSAEIISFIALTLSIILLLFVSAHVLKSLVNGRGGNSTFILAFFFLAILYCVFIKTCIPQSFLSLTLFSPYFFAYSDLLPSLGALLAAGLFSLVFSFWFYRFFKTPGFLNKIDTPKFKLNLFAAGALVIIFCSFLLIYHILVILVNNSSHASIIFKINDLNSAALFQIMSLAMFYMALSFIYERIALLFYQKIPRLRILLISLMISFSFWGICSLFHPSLNYLNFVFFLLITMIFFGAKRNTKSKHSYSTFVGITFLFSVYAILILFDYTTKKEITNRELLIENLSFKLLREEDPVAEMYLLEMENRLKKDTTLLHLIQQTDIQTNLIQEHLKKNYFYGYWGRYDFQVIPCWPHGGLHIEETDETVECYDYFDTMLLKEGVKINNSGCFYFLDNENGYVSYFGELVFLKDHAQFETKLYIELNSKPYFEGLGYPELLTGQNQQSSLGIVENYSFAKYINGALVKQYGTFRYPVDTTNFSINDSTMKKVLPIEGMSHMIYHPNEDALIILSRPQVKGYHILMAFSTFFIVFFFMASSILFAIRLRKGRPFFFFSIQERIQIAFISLMIALLLVMGVSSTLYSVYQFKQKHNQMLSQRIKSVLLEIEQKIGNEKSVSYDMEDYLQYLLQKFSNVFFSDINLYGLDGHLLATSRSEIYSKGLTGKLMNPQAFYELAYKKKTEFIHEESIGSMNFTSAYIPILNTKNQVLAYLNLPYFVGNNELKEQISSLVVAIINAYLLFTLFAIGLAVVISRRITHPLMLIQDRLAQIRLGKQNKKIEYRGEDEIGKLVSEYNRMVDELSESAEKLAKSERELAWREMAKQIAHEIKNPLTPMKLSVQYLTKAWEEKQETFETYLHRVSKTLIEQIDQLHVIANEFSNFAKMPLPKRKKVNIIERLQNTLSLFEKSSKDIHFEVETNDYLEINVFADTDQMVSVFNNIYKNAVQAIPNNRQGFIRTSVEIERPHVHITISDNGRGIDEEMKNKVFVPSFTTKSGGMGLGLAIVKNIIVNSGGEIWFHSTPGIGTTFHILLPIYDKA
ncbi:MAG: GHKL domain-containing protein [Marinilabiliaceae bacterium]|nr:GHKL domain-containing protein [Marinilabiliaceae bacterium]